MLYVFLQALIISPSLTGYFFDVCTQGSFDLFMLMSILHKYIGFPLLIFLLLIEIPFRKVFLFLLILPIVFLLFTSYEVYRVDVLGENICGKDYPSMVDSDMLKIVWQNFYFAVVIFFAFWVRIIFEWVRKSLKMR